MISILGFNGGWKSLLFSIFLLYTAPSLSKNYTTNEQNFLMGSKFEVTLVSNSYTINQIGIEKAWAEISRIEHIISSWDTNSFTSQINQQAGIKPVKVPKELFQLVQRSIKISRLTKGAFDISYASLDNLWDFKDSTLQIPDEKKLKKAVALIGYEKIVLNTESQTIFLKDKNMKIGFGAIGKGFAANKVKEMLVKMGFQNGLVNAGGDLIAWGSKADGSPWKIGIADPQKKNKIFSYLNINNGAVVTSGDYERFVLIKGKRYAHIINPKTGWPITGLKSVTIMCTDAELADALATAVFVLGKTDGLSLINQLNDIDCLLVTDSNKIIFSNNIKLNEKD